MTTLLLSNLLFLLCKSLDDNQIKCYVPSYVSIQEKD